MKNKTFLIIGACGAALIYAPLDASGQALKPASASPSPGSSSATVKTAASPSDSPAAKQRSIPFHGTVAEVDQTAKTFTLAGKKPRVFKLSDKTEITKDGKAATASDIAANQKVSGSYWKHEDGSLEAKTVKIGEMTEKKAEKPAKKSKKAKDSDSSAASPSPSPKS